MYRRYVPASLAYVALLLMCKTLLAASCLVDFDPPNGTKIQIGKNKQQVDVTTLENGKLSDCSDLVLVSGAINVLYETPDGLKRQTCKNAGKPCPVNAGTWPSWLDPFKPKSSPGGKRMDEEVSRLPGIPHGNVFSIEKAATLNLEKAGFTRWNLTLTETGGKRPIYQKSGSDPVVQVPSNLLRPGGKYSLLIDGGSKKYKGGFDILGGTEAGDIAGQLRQASSDTSVTARGRKLDELIILYDNNLDYEIELLREELKLWRKPAMDYAFHLLKAASLLLLLTGFLGCTGMQAVPVVNDVTDTINKGINKVIEFVDSKTGQDSKEDKYCDVFEESSYTVTDNVIQLASATGIKSLEEWSKSHFKRAPTGNNDIEEIVKTASKNYVWLPVSFEQTLGNRLHEMQVKNNKILDRNVKKNQKLYKKMDEALKVAVKDYTKLPYETRLYIVDSDQINAEALPAGYIYVTKKAASDLDDNALQLVLGHEMAHIAKRHTSKQIQQRLVETGVAVEMFQRILEQRSMDVVDKFFSGERVIESFNGKFAQYDQGQELQADACSIRGLLSAGVDPLKAREEYLRKRGTKEEAKSGSGKPTSRKPFGLGFTEHPEDKDRDRFFQEAHNYHLRKNKVACLGTCRDATAMGIKERLTFIG